VTAISTCSKQLDGRLADFVRQRYANWDSGIGARIEKGEVTLADLEACLLKKCDSAPNTSGLPGIPREPHQRVYLSCRFSGVRRNLDVADRPLAAKLTTYAPRKFVPLHSQPPSFRGDRIRLHISVCSRYSGAASHTVRGTFRRLAVGYESPPVIQTTRLPLANDCRRPLECPRLFREPGGDRCGRGNGQNGKRGF